MRRYLNFFIRWGVLGATLLFLTKTLMVHWQEVRSLELQSGAWFYAGLALGITIIAQLWSACVWGWILAAFKHSVPRRWTIVTFLKSTPAKYIPGNVWHFYGRIRAAQKQGLALESATLSIFLEPLFVMAGALGLALFYSSKPTLMGVSLAVILLVVHPRVLNYLWQGVRKVQGKAGSDVSLQHYPLRVLFGATVFMGLRGLAFLCVVLAFTPVTWDAFQPLVSGFSLAWLLSMVIPAPGGLGVFEASAVNVLASQLSPGLLLGAIAVYRLVSLGAEILGAGCAYLVNEGT